MENIAARQIGIRKYFIRPLSPFQGSLVSPAKPTARALGCILAPLRG
jgi:hypothetical protein